MKATRFEKIAEEKGKEVDRSFFETLEVIDFRDDLRYK